MPEERVTSSTGGQKGSKLARFDLIPARPLALLAEHYGKGAKKYAEHQWRKGFSWSLAIAALDRHFNDFKAGIDYDVCSNDPIGCLLEFNGQPWDGPDPDTCWNHTGSHHIQAVMWQSFCLMEFVLQFPEFDDRFKYEKDEAKNSYWSENPAPWTHYSTLENPIYADNTECCGIPLRGASFTKDPERVDCPYFQRNK